MQVVITVNLLANAALCLVMPRLARGGALPLAVGLAVMGAFQGCRVPATLR